MNIQRIQHVADNIRKRVLTHTISQNGGYMSQACSSAETFSALYLHIMSMPELDTPLKPGLFQGVPSADNMSYKTGAEYNGGHVEGFDRFYLSPAHYALVVYALLIETGRMTIDGLDYFNRDGYSVEMIGAEHSPGMEVTAGSLGQCISRAAGSALARKMKNDNGNNFVYLSDGEFQIGQTWEAIQAASHYKLDNLIIFADMNGQQCDGPVGNVMEMGSVADRLRSFGAEVVTVDGHDIEALCKSVETPHENKVFAVLCKTDPCRGLEILRRNAPKLHYLRFKSDSEKAEYTQILNELGGK
ncbi:MAG TPA: 1-deoxy-D-xylulose-5-phosphate synthase N-terminal domain-containing protein [bacterium]|nr:1-deoxy-D-xylulose-5-phosphate synthase N-terminal domain-containing protein [bacterium]HOG44431.1 1-deoxy-D-xylulose-5-phosphate synthase N-terminal domain-containing protein [bacterium]